MLVWSTFLTAVLAATDTTRLGPGPEVTITVDSSRKELVLTAGPYDLPNMPPVDEHAMMERSMSHDTPIQHFQWPIEGWLRGFELGLKDSRGNPVPRHVVHHMIVVNSTSDSRLRRRSWISRKPAIWRPLMPSKISCRRSSS